MSGARIPAYVFGGFWDDSIKLGIYASDVFTHSDGSTSDYASVSRLSKN